MTRLPPDAADAREAGVEAPRRGPWRFALALAVLCLAASVTFLVIVLVDPGTDGSPPAGPAGGGAPAGSDPRLSYAGSLPGGLDPGPFAPVEPGERADLRFESLAALETGAVLRRAFVPVVSLAIGVDQLPSEWVVDLLGGGTSDWADRGGLTGPVAVYAGPPEDDWLLAAWGITLAPAARRFATYDELVAAMGPGAGAIALVPLAAVRPSVSAVAVDGLDPVRAGVDLTRWRYVEALRVTAGSPRGEGAVGVLRGQLRVDLPRPITVVLTGDILQSRCTLVKIRATGDWGAALRSPVGQYLAAADLALGSLDGSIQDVSEPYGCVATTNLTSPPEVIEALTLAGIDGLTVATNHVFDCGQVYCGDRAFLRTLELLAAAGIRTYGGGRTLAEAMAPAVFEVAGVRFAVLGFDDVAAQEYEATETSPGTAPLDDDYAEERAAGEPAVYRPPEELSLERFTAAIRAAKAQADAVIVQVQTGTEETHDPTARTIKALRAAVGAGADLVVGNQAHWVQAVEATESSYIAYALGNFIFDQVWTPEHTEGVLLEATFHGPRLVNVRLRPYRIVDQYRPLFVAGDAIRKVLRDIYEASARLP